MSCPTVLQPKGILVLRIFTAVRLQRNTLLCSARVTTRVLNEKIKFEFCTSTFYLGIALSLQRIVGTVTVTVSQEEELLSHLRGL